MSEYLSVDADEWDEMTLRFDWPSRSDHVEDEATSRMGLSPGDVVVADVGKHTGPRSRRRTRKFNKTAYRVDRGDDIGAGKRLVPSDGRASELRILAGEQGTELWAKRRVSADARFHRVFADAVGGECDG